MNATIRPKAAGDQSTEQFAARRCRHNHQSENGKQKEFRWAECQHDVLGDRQNRKHGNRADDAAYGVRTCRRPDGKTALPC
jgi:hypothetical protein